MFNWSLHEIDETDIESLIPFTYRFPRWKSEQGGGGPKTKMAFADQVDFL